MHELWSQARQSYFINALLCCNFGMPLPLAGAINRKIILVKFVKDRKMNIFRYGMGETEKMSHAIVLFHTIVKKLC